MVNWSMKKSYDCKDLEDIVRLLRHPGGCPWDQEQTHRSIRRNFLEETYEVVEAIDRDDVDGLKEELGDVLLQVLFHTSIEEDAGRFDLDDVADGVCKKLIYRHPHVFGDVTVSSTGEILSNWEELKKKEKGQTTQADAVDAVARTLPALWRAEKMKKTAAKVGFDWKDVSGALDKLSEELEELDGDTAFALYKLADAGLEREDLKDCAVLRSAGATCEEAAVLVLSDNQKAKSAGKALFAYIDQQIAANEDYRPAEIPKLEDAVLDRRENTLLLAVAADTQAAKDAV